MKLILNKGDIFIRESYIWHKGTKNKSRKLRIIILFILSEKNPNYINQDILDNIKFGDNMFKVSIKDRIREFVSIYLPIFIFYINYSYHLLENKLFFQKINLIETIIDKKLK